MPTLEQALSYAGLSEKEARVYLAALELGSATATAISEKAAVNRATTYLVSENLIERGLMSSHQKDETRYFMAEEPDRLLGRLAKESETIEERKKTLEGALPELQALVKRGMDRPSVRYYEGMEGLETMREILYRNRRGEVLSAVNLAAASKCLPVDNVRAHQKRMKLYDLGGRVLYTCSDEEHEKLLSESLAKTTHEHRRVAHAQFPIEGEVVIFGNTVAFVSYADKVVGSILEHPHFATTARSLFELAWLAAVPK